MRDFVVAGAGFFGAAFARRATDLGKSCVVFDSRPYVGGAAHDQLIHGVHVHSHGAHIFHTDSEPVWQFVNRFGTWFPYINRPKAVAGDRVYSFPINMMTLHQVWGVQTPQQAWEKLQAVRLRCDEPRNFEEWALSMIGRELYELFIYGYTKKQWMCEPSELPASIIRRLPIRLTWDENYFCTKYQALPTDGYTSVVRNMLDGVEVHLASPLPGDWSKYGKQLVHTGRIDAYYGFQLGTLDFRTLRFETATADGDYQGTAVMNHVRESVPYLRSVEYQHFAPVSKQKHYAAPHSRPSVVMFDYPSKVGDPYYPVQDLRNMRLQASYEKLLTSVEHFGGRLGSYRYCDIDQTIASALTLADLLCTK